MKNSFLNQNIITQNQQIQLPILKEKGIELWIKREDLIHPEVSGNKFRKLKYNLLEAKKQGKRLLITFGGAYSNHILATAVASSLESFKSIGVIRGEELGVNLEETMSTNPTLRRAHEVGMEFLFVSRTDYRTKGQQEFLNQLKDQFGDFFLIPEGGTNELAILGCEEILAEEDTEFNYICSCVGTGGTISGLIRSSKLHQKVIGFPALKGDFLSDEIKKWTLQKQNWELIHDYHFGGYAKFSEKLIRFINEFKRTVNIPLDPVYTGKMIYGIFDLIQKDFFERGSKILVIHTGGIQGIDGFNQMQKRKNKHLRIE